MTKEQARTNLADAVALALESGLTPEEISGEVEYALDVAEDD